MRAIVFQLRIFASRHDEIPAFHAAYLVATFLVAALLNLGFFLILILAHMFLDIVKYRDYHRYSWSETARGVMAENIVDIALFMLALTFTVYLDHSFALVALSGLIRSELTLIKAVGTLVPKIEILEHAVRTMVHAHAYLHEPHQDLKKPLLRIHFWSIVIILLSVIMLAGAVILYNAHEIDLINVVKNELRLKL
ncbi:hypothetical protein A3A67_01720 [Candidatus Peribacteria bacterium RIFCSPLOWO2_01_FULL_51_18]|nr:MAG: hypothetical protein A3C52_03840 [Candidatus Peribacteria bacterium RIFCSPHIGHO2_02_FULL_51_15]OGJ65185.1 MAG: hypothetical protein A3A67_01720 [Candidatus Peribacteria bacterium RIFCSPLOWO2_01_FULL_51_18]OGJ67253.1 MAG: hypothetical protein A3J34_00965 [Candidatus Peribacteria bacterium RIFCSPLOWO2_02_FULL_51_10]